MSDRKGREERRKEREREALLRCIDYELVTDPRSLFQASIECERGVIWKRPAQHFILHERGKARLISAVQFRDRVVQKSLCENSLVPLLSRGLIYDNSATLKGKGTEFARLRFAKHLRRAWGRWGSAGYLVHYDFASYFASIDQRRAMGRLERKLMGLCRSDGEVLAARRILWLARQFVYEEERGLGLGNQTSQIIAVEYANPIDHMICEVLRLGLSGRYMDDGYAFCPDAESARVALGAIEAKANTLGLTLHSRKCGIEPAQHVHVFLKYRYQIDSRSGEVRLTPVADTLRRYRRRHLEALAQREDGAVPLETLHQGALQLVGPAGALLSAHLVELLRRGGLEPGDEVVEHECVVRVEPRIVR